MAKKKILIVGAGGFVGKALSQQLLSSKDDIILAARKKITGFPGAKKLYGNLEDRKYCKKIVQGIDIVYYVAAFKKNIGVHLRTPFDAASGNISPLLSFLDAAKGSSVKKIIYASSTIVEYAGGDYRDGYVLGKYINEIILKSFSAQTKIDVKIVRSAAVYGVGNDLDPETANLIPALIGKADKAKDELVVWGKGVRKLQFIYVDDLIANLIAASQSRESFFAIGNPESVSINTIVKKITTLMDKKLRICHDLSKGDKSTKLSSFNNLVNPKVNLSNGLQKTIADYLAHHTQNNV